MELQKLLNMQDELETIIVTRCNEKGVSLTEEEKIKSMLIEVLCEAGELANELQVHKYWKHNKSINEESEGKSITELSDLYLSLLSLTNLLDYQASDIVAAIIAKYGVNVKRQEEGY